MPIAASVSLAHSPDGETLAVEDYDSHIHLWNVSQTDRNEGTEASRLGQAVEVSGARLLSTDLNQIVRGLGIRPGGWTVLEEP